jgi:hypothetical protein
MTLRGCALNAGAGHAAAQNQFMPLHVRNGAQSRIGNDGRGRHRSNAKTRRALLRTGFGRSNSL